MLATIKNVSRQPVTLILDHPAFANKASGWQRATTEFANLAEDGSRQITEVRRAYAGSLTLMPGQQATGIHPAIQNCTQVPALLARKVLEITLQDEPAPAAETKDTSAKASKPPGSKESKVAIHKYGEKDA